MLKIGGIFSIINRHESCIYENLSVHIMTHRYSAASDGQLNFSHESMTFTHDADFDNFQSSSKFLNNVR